MTICDKHLHEPSASHVHILMKLREKNFKISFTITCSRLDAVVRALAYHQCVLGSIPGPGVTCGLSLLVLYSAPRDFSPGTPVFPARSPQKPTFDLIQRSCPARVI